VLKIPESDIATAIPDLQVGKSEISKLGEKL
jgi:hypothetical protein